MACAWALCSCTRRWPFATRLRGYLTFQLGRHKARCVAVRLLMPPVENRTYHFHGIRLSTFGSSPCSHEAFLPISPAPQCIPRGQLARSLGTFVPVFPKARGLRYQSPSWCTWLSHALTTMPHPTPHEGIGVSYGSRLPTSTLLRILHKVSRVRHTGLKRNDLGGALLSAPSALCGFPIFHRVCQVYLCYLPQQGSAVLVLISARLIPISIDWLTS